MTTSHTPEIDCKSFDDAVRALKDSFDSIKEDLRGGEINMREAEEALRRATAEVERVAVGVLLKGLDIDASAIEVDGEVCLPAGCRLMTYYAVSGPVCFKRHLYRRPDGSLVVPVEVRAGLV